jgi:acyl-coenzyme A thioesterase PaaI-like protein
VTDAISIRNRILRGLALNRTPGYHFTGNFLSLSFEKNSEQDVQLSMAAGPHNVEANGNVSYGALAVLADIALAANVRAGHTPASRLATVQMNLQFTGAPMTGRLHAASALQGYVQNITSVQGAGQVTVTANGKPVCYGVGTFMVLNPPKGVALYPMSHRKDGDPDVAPLREDELQRDERRVLALTDAALADTHKDSSFIRRFWGFDTHAITGGASGKLNNGPHVGNRVGHLQGGITMGLGIATAETALPASWTLSAVTAWYISPGEGRVIKAKSKIIHHGRLTSVVRTEITGKNKRRVMEMITTHAHKSE